MASYGKRIRTEHGTKGAKSGHAERWEKREFIKAYIKKVRRRRGRAEIQQQLKEE